MRILSRYRNNIRKRAIRKMKKKIEDFKVLLARWRILSYNNEFTKFIILTRSRSGSNLLTSYLESHKDVYIRGEILGKRGGKPIENFMRNFFTLQPSYIRASGFKIFYYHPIDDSSGEVWEKLLAVPNIKIIHLKRDNLFELAVSRSKAIHTGFWSSSEGVKNISIQIDPEECLQLFEKTRGWERKFEKMLSNHDVLDIKYENLVRDPINNLLCIQKFLKIPPSSLKSFRRKQQKQPIAKVVSNYNEVKQYFQGTKWEVFFYDKK